MAYQPQKDSIVEVTLRCTMNGQAMLNVLHYQPTAPGSGSIGDGRNNLLQFINTIDVSGTGWSALRSVSCADLMTIDTITAQYIWPERFVRLVEPTSTTSGSLTGLAAPQNVAAFVQLLTDESGRQFRGGMHVGGLSAADVGDGFLANTLKSSLDTEATFLLGPITTTTAGLNYVPIIYQRLNPVASASVTQVSVEATSRTMRRRGVGLGI